MRHNGSIFLPCHFGEWLQGRLGPEGPLALVSLMPRGVGLRAIGLAGRDLSCHAIGYGAFDPYALRRFDRALGDRLQGRVMVRLPYAPGQGTGMSTATLLAVARLLKGGCGTETLARACVAAEGASDPLMFDAPSRFLWASREGRILSQMPPQPRADILAGFWGAPRPTRAEDQEYDDISDLVARWRAGGSLAEYAALASESARRCLVRRGPQDDPTPQLARDLGALGWAISHSGSARALLFEPGQRPTQGVTALREAGLRGVHMLTTDGR